MANKPMMKEEMFSGELSQTGPIKRLSNHEELAASCPEQFKDYNDPWTSYILDFFLDPDHDTSKWKWKTDNRVVRESQRERFMCVLKSLALTMEDRNCVSGWMLSEMLSEVPSHIPAEAVNFLLRTSSMAYLGDFAPTPLTLARDHTSAILLAE